VLINGVTVTVKVAHVRLCHSRMLFVRAYPRETQENTDAPIRCSGCGLGEAGLVLERRQSAARPDRLILRSRLSEEL
jgi:hypothetical protein